MIACGQAASAFVPFFRLGAGTLAHRQRFADLAEGAAFQDRNVGSPAAMAASRRFMVGRKRGQLAASSGLSA